MSPIMGLDLRVHLAAGDDGVPACGAGGGDDGQLVTKMVTMHGPAVTCSACLVSAAMAAA